MKFTGPIQLSSPIRHLSRQRLWPVLLACAAVAVAPRAAAGELLVNGGFGSGLAGWEVPEKLGSWSPLTNSTVLLEASDYEYTGVLLYQNLNVSGAAGATLQFSVSLLRDYSYDDQTLAFCVDYATADSQFKRVQVSSPLDASLTNVFTTVSASLSLPSEAVKLVRFLVLKNGYGTFYADNFSLTASGLTAAAVPAVATLSPQSGPYGDSINGQTITITGTDFGTTPGEVWVGYTPVDYVGRSTPGGLAQVISWANTQIVARVVEPCRSGRVNLLVNKVESNGGTTFNLTSPNFTVDTPYSDLQVIRGQVANLVLAARFLNGFQSTGGVSFQLEGLAGIPHNQPLRTTGGCGFEIPSAGLTNGLYQGVARSVEAHSAARSVPFTLRVLSITNIDFSENPTITMTNQNELPPINHTLWQSDGKEYQYPHGAPLYPDLISTASSDTNVLLVYHDRYGDRFFAISNGTANLIFTSVNGVSKALPVTVTLPDSPKFIRAEMTPGEMDNSGTTTNRAVWETVGRTIQEVGYSGDGPENTIYWGNPLAMDVWVTPGTQPGIYEFYAAIGSSYPGPMIAKVPLLLKVTNAAGRGEISGRVFPVGGSEMHAFGDLEVYDLTGALVATQSSYGSFDSAPYVLSYLNPGSYKVRFIPSYRFAALWYPNAQTFDQAAAVQVKAGQTTADINFYLLHAESPLLPQPQIRNGMATFEISTLRDVTYILEYCDNLVTPNWQTAQTVVGTGSDATLTHAVTGGQRFYRLRLID